ncbi:DUF748 domain-containing protein [Rhodoferax sp.]|uniref:DUF748 domain-containing protein n=1 Tax=Rhodoferax sp. TaxID=50421 RepID=UPI00271D5D87|nr:DUF748 domain-containing protein [Rhodoferax sp.]MDO9196650.1 DUF748 domain-containing protein [Rhodoferax sp.]
MDVKAVRQNKWFKRVARTVGGVLALWAVTWLAVPSIVKNQVEQLATEQLGRRVTLGGVDFKPWSLELTLHDLAMARADGVADPSPQLLVKRFYIDAELQSLVRWAPVVDAIQVEEPHLRVTRLDTTGRYDVDDILARLSKPNENPDGAPLQFALHNLVLSGGAMDFADKAVGKTHQIRDLQVNLPFLSNLASQRTVLVEPRLAFQLNGSRFDSSAQGTPFAQTHKTDAALKISDLDLGPYLGYIPASLPVRLTSAILNAELKLAFEQAPRNVVKLSGTAQAGKVRVVSAGSAPNAPQGVTAQGLELLVFDLLKVTLEDVRPLERVARLATVELNGPILSVHRAKSGQLNLASLFKPRDAPENIAPGADTTGAKAGNGVPVGWAVAVPKVLLRNGAIDWTDDGTTPAARLGLRDLTVDASAIALPFAQPFQLGGSARVAPGASAKAGRPENPARVSFEGNATDQIVNVTATVADLPLGAAGPYLADFMTPVLSGTLNGEFGVTWKASKGLDQPAELLLQAPQLTLDNAALTLGKTNLASVKRLQVAQAAVDLDRQTAAVGKLSVTQPKVAIGREVDGRWMFESWLTTAKTGLRTASTGAAGRRSPAELGKERASPAKSWSWEIDEVALDGGAVAFSDKLLAKPVSFDLSALAVQLKNVSSAGSKPFQAHVATQIRAGRTPAGRLDWRGSAGLSPLAVQGRVDAVRVPVHAFEPYLADTLNIELLRADTSFKGQVSYAQKAAGPVLKVSGDTTIEDFLANTLPALQGAMAAGSGPAAAAPGSLQIGEELLRWKVLSLRGLDAAVAPGVASRFAVRETVLSDFFARLILSEAGRLNLQDVVKSSAEATAPAPAPAASAPDAIKNIADDAASTRASAQNDPKSALPAVISFGPISLLGGRVEFSDRFIQPNYSASLTELTGKLSAFSSQTQPGVVNLADLELRGRAEGTASVEILGKVNPLTTPVVLDIKGQVRDLELPPLSPYSVRYAGYGIERGKLTVDVSYLVQPYGQLVATNQIVLNQLTFGDKVEGAPGNLPVKLAVALLADRQGVIDINLPISGSLSDPQFRLGPIIFRMIVNLIVKAITSPFTLLASAFGGGADELSVVSFAPGSAVLAPEARPGLQKVAQALIERPALKMTVVGTASLEVERDAFKREQLKALVQAEKRRAAVVGGGSPKGETDEGGRVDDATVALTEAEYPALLKAVYRRADFPKPRNLVGMTKDIPVNEMEALLLAHLAATDDDMRELALQRGVTVRDYLASQKLPLERLFLGAAKAVPPEAKWSPRAELNLSTR